MSFAIKIGASDNDATKEKARLALADVTSGSGRQMLGPNMWFAEDGTFVEVSVFDSSLMISGIYVPPDMRGNGIGSQILKELLDAADRNGARCRLTAQPFGHDKGLNKRQLASWYKRHGFEKSGGDSMRREPMPAVNKMKP